MPVMKRLSGLSSDPRIATLAAMAAAASALWWALASMPMMAMPQGWSAGVIGSTAVMWLLMMLAMMLPAMAPVMAIYAGLAAKEDRGGRLALRILVFFAGYFSLWAVVSVALSMVQLGLRDSAWFEMGGTVATPLAAGVLMLIAGAYQLTGVKDACLRHCRSPLAFLLQHWREGLGGAFPMGLRHGLYCVGCCIALMGLMFLFGAMNPLWMAMIAAYFVAEKLLPAAERWSRWVGIVLIGMGLSTLATSAAHAENPPEANSELAHCASQAAALTWFYQGAVNDGVPEAQGDLESLKHMQAAYIQAVGQSGEPTVVLFKSMTKSAVETLTTEMQASREGGVAALAALRTNVLTCAEKYFEKG